MGNGKGARIKMCELGGAETATQGVNMMTKGFQVSKWMLVSVFIYT